MPPVALLVLGVAAVALFFAYEKSSGQQVTVIPGSASGGGGTTIVQAPTAPGGSAAPPAAGSPSAAVGSTPSSSSSSSAPSAGSVASLPADSLAWIFKNGQDALKAGLGNVYDAGNGALAVTGPKGAITLSQPSVIHATKNDAAKAGTGSIYQENGKYYVFGPGFPIQLSEKFQPHVASADLSSYGSVSGVVRGWTVEMDRFGNATPVPAHTVQGSTYAGDAQGEPPTAAEWAALGSMR